VTAWVAGVKIVKNDSPIQGVELQMGIWFEEHSLGERDDILVSFPRY
jgi:hypothetical protein